MRMLPGGSIDFLIVNARPTIASDPHHLDTTNVHTHGLHVPASPSDGATPTPTCGDNIFCEVGPGEQMHFRSTIHTDHAAGTYWYHPHVHGSTATQVGGGLMAGMIIVEDDVSTLPSELAAMADVPLVLQCLYFDAMGVPARERIQLAAEVGVVGEGVGHLTPLAGHRVARAARARHAPDRLHPHVGRRAVLLAARTDHELAVAAEDSRDHPRSATQPAVDTLAAQAHEACRLQHRRQQPLDAWRATQIEPHHAAVVFGADLRAEARGRAIVKACLPLQLLEGLAAQFSEYFIRCS